jgi:hypothetical protein
MSQQAAARQQTGRGGSRKPGYFPKGRGVDTVAKAYKSSIPEIEEHTFNTGQNKFAAQFTQSRENVANFLQRTTNDEGYLVAKTVRTRKQQTIDLPPPIDGNDPNAEDLKIINAEEVKSVAKRWLKLEELLKKGCVTVYSQFAEEAWDKLKSGNNWERIQKAQSLHKLIAKIEKICVGFDNHKQEVYNLVQSLKTLFLYTQSGKETVEEYGCNFRSLWDTVEVFSGSPGVHEGLVRGILNNTMQGTTPTAKERSDAEEASSEAVKSALLISGAGRRKYGKLKDKLVNNYLLGTDQYPDTFEKAICILGNYQTTTNSLPYRPSPNDTGVVFLQRGGRGGRGAGRVGQGSGDDKSGSTGGGATGDDMSAMAGRTSGGESNSNSKGESHCFNCNWPSHWAYKCPQLSNKQQAQLHMNIEAQGEECGKEQDTQEGHQMLHVTLAQGGMLPNDRAFLDGCSTVTAFKSDKHLKNIKTVRGGVKINCNVGTVTSNLQGTYGGLKVVVSTQWNCKHLLNAELEQSYCITYDSWDGYYVVHTQKGEVRFHKDEQGLPYINLGESDSEAAMMLLQREIVEHEETMDSKISHIQTVHGNYEGYAKREVTQAKEACRAQAMMGNPSEKDYKGMVRNILIPNCPITSKV